MDIDYKQWDKRKVFKKETLTLSDYSKVNNDYHLVMAITTDKPVFFIHSVLIRLLIRL